MVDRRHSLRLHGLHRQSNALQQRSDDALAVLQQSCQNVDRLQLRVAMLAGEIVSPLDSLLRLHGQFVPSNCHNSLLKLRRPLGHHYEPYEMYECWIRTVVLFFAMSRPREKGGDFRSASLTICCLFVP